nr:glycosyltransferase family 4 protein [Pacificispira spongiicola]
MHIRTRPPKNVFGRWQARVASASCDSFVHISENEGDWFRSLAAGRCVSGRVVLNPVHVLVHEDGPSARNQETLMVLCLSNYSFPRGIDRLIDVAACLDAMGDRAVRFVVAGDMHLPAGLTGDLGDVARRGGTLADVAARRGVADRFDFLGHVSKPEQWLGQADVLVKPTREDNPWGRDIIEALGHGVPVASVGTYDKFVESHRTGLLQKTFDAAELAAWLCELAADRGRLDVMRKAAAERIAELCNPVRQAASVVDLWRDTVEARRR